MSEFQMSREYVKTYKCETLPSTGDVWKVVEENKLCEKWEILSTYKRQEDRENVFVARITEYFPSH
jgi:hypothetical protein